MTSDMMLVCKEDNSHYRGEDCEIEAVFLDECSMGEPLHEFGKWMNQRYCGTPGFFEQLAGFKDSHFIELTKEDVLAIKEAFKNMKHHSATCEKTIFDYLDSHIGKHICTENW